MSAKTIEKKLNKVSRVKKNPKMLRAVELIKEKIENGKEVVISKTMLEAGYSESSAHDCSIMKTRAFKDLLEEYLPDSSLLGVVKDLIDPSNEDKNTRLAAAKEGFRLKDRYPASKLQLNAFQDATNDILTEDD